MLGSIHIRRRASRAELRAPALLMPIDPPIAVVPGPDPDRVLLIGSGPVAGVGVASHHQALTGELARLLVEHSRRGAAVESIGRVDLRLVDVPALLEIAHLERFDAVVVTAGMAETAALTSPRRWARDLRSVLETARVLQPMIETVLVTGIPSPTSTGGVSGWRGKVLDEHAMALNRISEATIASHRYGHFAQLAGAPHRDGQPTSTCYALWASQICEVLEPLLSRAADEIRSDRLD